MKKNILVPLFLFLCIALQSQVLPDGRRFRQRVVDRTPGTTTAQRNPDFDIDKAVGLTIYEVERITKKLSIKESEDNYKKVTQIFNQFNKDMRQVKRINGFLLNQAKTKIETARSEVMDSRDYSVLEKAYKEVSEGFKPITAEIEKKEEQLDKDLKAILSEKEFKKWKKLQKKIKKKG